MWPPDVRRPRCMLHHLGASYLVGAPASSTEQSGSDKVQTLFKRFPRRPRVPEYPFGSPVKQGARGKWLMKDQGVSRRSFLKIPTPGDSLVSF